MIDPREFKAPFIKIEDIRKAADDLRARYWPKNSIPIDILSILEFELEVEIRPILNLKKAGDVDALLLGDFRTIVVDQGDFLDDRAQNRLRFSLAHELGHLTLHKGLFSEIRHSLIQEWINFFQQIPDKEYYWIEQHAYEFAGRLLVPREHLKEKLGEAILIAKDAGFEAWDASGESSLEYIAHGIARYFNVSEQVVEKRIIKENLWPPSKIA